MRTSTLVSKAVSEAELSGPSAEAERNGHAAEANDVADSDASGTKASERVAGKGEQQKVKSSFFQLMDRGDKTYWYIGAFLAACGGARFPLMALYVGDMFDDLGRPGQTNFVEVVKPSIFRLAIAGVISGMARAASDVCIAALQHRMVAKYQHQYLDTLLHKDSKWYDDHGAAVLLSNLSTAVFSVSDLYCPDLVTCIMGISAFLLSMAAAISRSWQLGCIMLGSLPFMIIATTLGFKNFMLMAKSASSICGVAALNLDQAITGIKTVQSYGLERHMVSNISPWVKMVAKICIPQGRKGSLFFSSRMFVEWGAAALMFFVGSRFIIAGDKNPMTGSAWMPGNVFSVWFIQYLGISQLQLSTTYFQSFGEGKAALLELSKLQSDGIGEIEGHARQADGRDSAEGLEDIHSIEFENVSFRYPSRPERLVLENITFAVKRGQKIALVGESGSGKSTIVQLIQRFYDPEAGSIRVNGQDLRQIPLSKLRRSMALVEQEPVLFAASLKENLEYAKPKGGLAITEQSLQEVMDSCCMDFVNSLPCGANTYVGARGGTLSGGQKQRACIARALLREPQLLLLDEATAALDNETEKSVQQTLHKVVERLGTSITIAHRLSTIRKSDNILVFKDGHIVEHGCHEDLMNIGSKGLYYGLVKLQDVAESAESGYENGSPLSTNVDIDTGEKGDVAGFVVPKVSSKNTSLEANVNVVSQNAKDTVDTSRITPKKLSAVVRRLAIDYLQDPFITVHLAIGWIGHICMSAANPVFAIVLISMLTGLYQEGGEREKRANESTVHLIVLGCLQFLFCHCRIGVALKARQLQMVRSRLAIASNLMHQDVSFFDNPECTAAKIVVVFSTLIQIGDQAFSTMVPEQLSALVTLLVTFIIALSKQPRIALGVAAVWPINMISKYIEFRDLMKKFRRGKNSDAETQSAQLFHDCISNLKTVRANQCEDQMMAEFEKLVEQEGFKSKLSMMLTGIIKGVAYTLELLLYAFAFWWSAKAMEDGEPFEDCVQAMMCIMLGLMPVTSVLNSFDNLDAKVDAAARVFDFKNYSPTLHKQANCKDAMPAQALDIAGKTLCFDQVRFRYAQRPDVDVLKSTSFKVQIGAGNMVGLCGPSGGGKSTVLALLARFYDPSEGSISVKGLGELRDFDVREWRRCIGFVQQEPVLFQDSLLNNVRYGNPAATPQELKEAALMAHLDFVSDAPEFDPAERMPPPSILLSGELKNVGLTKAQFEAIASSVHDGSIPEVNEDQSAMNANEQGASEKKGTGSVSWKDTVRQTSLSGGQKQRVAIARSFLRKPAILIFDEATSALDSHSEKKIQDSLSSCRKSQTQFLIAHRLSTISDADLIMVVSMGVIAEAGTAQELLQQRGLYFNLVQSQSEHK